MSKTENPVPRDTPEFEIAAARTDDHGDITVTLPRGKFAEFLLGFLGPKETLSKPYPDDFIVKLDDIFQFHHLLEHKIKNEQFISLSLATATIHYDDGTNRTINTIESLEKFNEYRDLEVISFNLIWQFVFRVPDQNAIRQQKVNLLFDAKGRGTTGEITVSIEHSNQLWAVEVLRLFEEQIKKVRVPYSLAYRTIDSLRRLNIFGVLMTVALFTLVVGIIYITIQISNLRSPAKVEAEFMFDVADVVAPKANNREGISPRVATDSNLLMQFFLIRDLRRSDHGVIEHLYRRGFFDERYSAVIEKMKSGYYDKNIESSTIVRTLKTELEQLVTIEKITEIFGYLKVIELYVFSYLIAALYLRLFRMRSVIAITSKSTRTLEKQQRDKSNVVQVIFGVIASLIATLIYEYSFKLFL